MELVFAAFGERVGMDANGMMNVLGIRRYVEGTKPGKAFKIGHMELGLQFHAEPSEQGATHQIAIQRVTPGGIVESGPSYQITLPEEPSGTKVVETGVTTRVINAPYTESGLYAYQALLNGDLVYEASFLVHIPPSVLSSEQKRQEIRNMPRLDALSRANIVALGERILHGVLAVQAIQDWAF